MSIKVMDWVWQHSTHKGSALLLLLAIADHAHDDGDGAYPSIATLAQKTRMSERQTTRLIQDLVESQELVVGYKEGPLGANIYQVTFCIGSQIQGSDILSPGGSDILSPATDEVVTKNGGGGDIASYEGGDIAMSPKPSLTVREPGEPPLTPPLGKKRDTQITEEFRAAMRGRFGPTFGATVDERIDEALAHEARLKWTDLQLYIQRWLRRDAERVSATGPPGNGLSNRPRRRSIHERMMEVERATPSLREPVRP